MYDNYNEENNLQTPHEVGDEQTRRILSVEPAEGFISSYSQIPLTFLCKSYVQEDHRIWVKNYSMAKEELPPIEQDYEYTAIFNFSNPNEIETDIEPDENSHKILMMKATAICPKLVFHCQNLNFGEIQLGEEKTIEVKIENRNDIKEKITVVAPGISQFTIEPKRISLNCLEVKSFKVTFKPSNLGSFNVKAKFVMEGEYDFFVQLKGKAYNPKRTIEKKSSGLIPVHQSIDMASLRKSKSKQSMPALEWSGAVSLELPSLRKNDSVDYLKLSRIERKQNLKEKKICESMEKMDGQIRDYIAKKKFKKKGNETSVATTNYGSQQTKKDKEADNPFFDDPDFEEDAYPKDIRYLFQEDWNGLNAPGLDIPLDKVDQLFVTRPIGPYEPYTASEGVIFNPDPTVPARPQPSKPSSHGIMRECNSDLTGEMLKRINAGPKLIDFGVMFVNSDSQRWFYIKNDLKGAISSRLQLNHENVMKSYNKIQIVGSGLSAGFLVNFNCAKVGAFSNIISYVINEKNVFKFMVKAEVIPVNLELNKTALTLRFNDDSLDMETSEMIRVKNTGNAPAKFSWTCNNSSLRCEPKESFCPAYSTCNVQIIYNPQDYSLYEEEVLEMDIVDGNFFIVK